MAKLAKPLKWYKPTDHPQDEDEAVFMARGIGGRYSITQQSDHVLLWMADDGFVWKQFKTIREAKEAAEQDWQKQFGRLSLNGGDHG